MHSDKPFNTSWKRELEWTVTTSWILPQYWLISTFCKFQKWRTADSADYHHRRIRGDYGCHNSLVAIVRFKLYFQPTKTGKNYTPNWFASIASMHSYTLFPWVIAKGHWEKKASFTSMYTRWAQSFFVFLGGGRGVDWGWIPDLEFIDFWQWLLTDFLHGAHIHCYFCISRSAMKLAIYIPPLVT